MYKTPPQRRRKKAETEEVGVTEAVEADAELSMAHAQEQRMLNMSGSRDGSVNHLANNVSKYK
jgi:hypothetical protein